MILETDNELSNLNYKAEFTYYSACNQKLVHAVKTMLLWTKGLPRPIEIHTRTDIVLFMPNGETYFHQMLVGLFSISGK